MLDHHDAIVGDVEIYLMLALHTHDAVEMKEVADIHKDTKNMVGDDSDD